MSNNNHMTMRTIIAWRRKSCAFLPVLALLSLAISTGRAMAPPSTTTTSRRGFCAIAVSSSSSALFLPFLVLSNTAPAHADEDQIGGTFAQDLAMPTPEEIKIQEEAAMAARLKRKAELQKKASQSNKSFLNSLKTEIDKQNEYSKVSKEDRRNALCEELGRGC